MANHAYVKTKKKMTSNSVDKVIRDLNDRLFKSILKIERNEDFWNVSYIADLRWLDRTCWLTTSRTFEIRHGGGSKFEWWWDCALQNEIAVFFDGTMSDDGIEEKWKGVPGKYDNFQNYVDLYYEHIKEKSPLEYRFIVQNELEFVPKEFRFDIGKKVSFDPKNFTFQEVV